MPWPRSASSASMHGEKSPNKNLRWQPSRLMRFGGFCLRLLVRKSKTHHENSNSN